MKRPHVLAGLLCAVLLACGCASSNKDAKSDLAAAAVKQEAPAELHLAQFIVGVGDGLEVSVYRHDDLTRSMTVGISGKVMFPLIGDIEAAGKDLFALRDEIADKLSRYLVKPVVTIQMIAIQSRRAMMLGEVRTPGSFVLDTELTVLDALSKTGGATNDANLGNVLLVRNAGGGKKTEIYLDVKKAMTGEDYASNIPLQNGDVLYVPTKGLATMSRYTSYITSIVSPIVAIEGGIVLWPLVKDVINGKEQSNSQVTIPTSR